MAKVSLKVWHGLEAGLFRGVEKSFPPHFHKNYLLGALLSGTRQFHIQQSGRIIKKHDLILIKPYQIHACERMGSRENIWIYLQISTRLFHWLNEKIFHLPVLWERQLVPANSQTRRIIAEMLRLALSQKALDRPAHASEYLQPLLDTLAALAENAEYQRPPQVFTPTITHPLCAYFEEHSEEAISLRDMAAYMGMDKYQLVRKFARATGLTPYKYLENIRVLKAAELIKNGIIPADCALKSGFYDQSHFTRGFVRYLGYPPGYYGKIYSRHGPLEEAL